jgi:hypothetical protein
MDWPLRLNHDPRIGGMQLVFPPDGAQSHAALCNASRFCCSLLFQPHKVAVGRTGKPCIK